MKSRIHLVDHPLAQDRLARLRDKSTMPQDFRRHMEEIAMVLGVEALRRVSVRATTVPTPFRNASARKLERPLAFVAILRAGLGLLPGLLALAPEAAVGHIGLYRDEDTLKPVRYHVRLPPDLSKRFVILCDPMLATGGSAAEALSLLKEEGAKDLALMVLLAAKAGIARVRRDHPDVPIYAAGVDPVLDRNGFIVPGLGDAGDRLFGT